MLESVRARLTLWYTGVLALVLIVLSLTTYFILRRTTAQRVDSSLMEIGDAFLTTLHAELRDDLGPDSFKNAALEAMIEHRFRDQIYVILDGQGQIILTSTELPARKEDNALTLADLVP